MMILRALSLLFIVSVFSLTLFNQELIVKYVESVHLPSNNFEVVCQSMEQETLLNAKQDKPTFMQVEKINQHELPAQARIGYLLSRGF